MSKNNRSMKFTPEYGVWYGIIKRCTNPKATNYKHYGGKGIKVCTRWTGPDGFANFLADVGLRPSSNHSIDRYPNNNGDYEPGNCRWATQAEQLRNYSRTRNITFRGRTQCATDWEAELGLGSGMLMWRIKKWGVEQAFTIPADGARAERNRRGLNPKQSNRATSAKLTTETVMKIHEMLASGLTPSTVAKNLELARSTVRAIAEGRTWSWLKAAS